MNRMLSGYRSCTASFYGNGGGAQAARHLRLRKADVAVAQAKQRRRCSAPQMSLGRLFKHRPPHHLRNLGIVQLILHRVG